MTNSPQLGGSFNSINIFTLKVPYCNAGSDIYAVLTYEDGTLVNTFYELSPSNPITLTVAQIAALVPGHCKAKYDQEGTPICANGTTLLRVDVFDTYSTNTTPGVPITVFLSLTGTPVAPPASFTFGECVAAYVPTTAQVYHSAAVPVTPVALAGSNEITIYNRTRRDLIFTWVGTASGSGGTLIVPAQGNLPFRLRTTPNEGAFATYSITTGSFGTGGITSNSIAINFKK